jgi:hypothetical protein
MTDKALTELISGLSDRDGLVSSKFPQITLLLKQLEETRRCQQAVFLEVSRLVCADGVPGDLSRGLNKLLQHVATKGLVEVPLGQSDVATILAEIGDGLRGHDIPTALQRLSATIMRGGNGFNGGD